MESYDSLPYIDAEITQTERDAAVRAIRKELPKGFEKELHPSLQHLSEPNLSQLMRKEVSRVAAGDPRGAGIDTSRYEAPDEPSSNEDIEEWKKALRDVYMSSTYLSGRKVNLALLEEYGKNAWLIGNYELEGILKSLEAELANVKAQTEEVNKGRKMAQEDSHGEMLALEATWKKGIGRIIEVQVATEQLRNELSQHRGNATG